MDRLNSKLFHTNKNIDDFIQLTLVLSSCYFLSLKSTEAKSIQDLSQSLTSLFQSFSHPN
jgi:hypothetical protein